MPSLYVMGVSNILPKGDLSVSESVIQSGRDDLTVAAREAREARPAALLGEIYTSPTNLHASEGDPGGVAATPPKHGRAGGHLVHSACLQESSCALQPENGLRLQ